MDIDPEDFALECIQWALYCGVQAHYMVAVAQMRGKGFNDATDGDQIGPFRLTQAAWDAFRSDAEFEIKFDSSQITSWRRQCLVFAVMTDRAFDRFGRPGETKSDSCGIVHRRVRRYRYGSADGGS